MYLRSIFLGLTKSAAHASRRCILSLYSAVCNVLGTVTFQLLFFCSFQILIFIQNRYIIDSFTDLLVAKSLEA